MFLVELEKEKIKELIQALEKECNFFPSLEF